jgi:hypothetical protein
VSDTPKPPPEPGADPAGLARALIFRDTTQRYRFLFVPQSANGLIVRSLGKAAAAPLTAMQSALERRGTEVFAGTMLVDDDSRCVFCLATAAAGFLPTLADWTQRRIAAIPALVALADAGVAVSGAAIGSDAAVLAIDPAALAITREPALWADLLRADVVVTASVLAAARPGERLWYWVALAADDAAPPLLLQPVASDPNHGRMDHLIRQVRGPAGRRGATGTCLVVDDGRLQFRGPDLDAPALAALAEWVRAQAAAHPALARLSGCQFLVTGGGKAAAVLEDAALWHDIARPPVAGTLADSATRLAGLQGGSACWFWLTGTGQDGPFLDVADLASDPDGVGFAERAAYNYRRFARSFGDAISGVLRAEAAELVFVTQDGRVDHWPALMRQLAAQAAYPGFAGLGNARLIQCEGEQPLRSLRATEVT